MLLSWVLGASARCKDSTRRWVLGPQLAQNTPVSAILLSNSGSCLRLGCQMAPMDGPARVSGGTFPRGVWGHQPPRGFATLGPASGYNVKRPAGSATPYLPSRLDNNIFSLQFQKESLDWWTLVTGVTAAQSTAVAAGRAVRYAEQHAKHHGRWCDLRSERRSRRQRRNGPTLT